MSTNVSIDANISELAEKLGIAANELIGLYAPRAYAELVDPLLFLIALGLIILLYNYLVGLTENIESPNTKQDARSAIHIFGVILIFITSILTLTEVSEAISAVASPKGWAIGKLITLIKM